MARKAWFVVYSFYDGCDVEVFEKREQAESRCSEILLEQHHWIALVVYGERHAVKPFEVVTKHKLEACKPEGESNADENV